MRNTKDSFGGRWAGAMACAAVAAVYLVFGAAVSFSQERTTASGDAALLAAHSAGPANFPSDAKTEQNPSTIPVGTILPVILRTTIAPAKMQQGQTIRGEIAQEVPLGGGATIPKGSKVEGQVLDVVPPGSEGTAKVSVRFDKVYSRGRTIAMTTDLRALAGSMEVQEAALPDETPGEGDVAQWSTTTQIGGDSVYGAYGPVMSAEDPSKVVGKAVNDGVLVEVRAKEGTKCRGAIQENHNPQAMWVFSSDACGVYGLSNVNIEHAGRTEPVGMIVLELQGRNTKVRSASGMLLRVIG